jgi:cell pole-organizing protein PopZ
MAKPNQAQDQTMEEILASIRRIISDDEAREVARPEPPSTEARRPVSNVAHLFAEPFATAPSAKVVELPIEPRIPEEPIIDSEAFAAALEAEEDILTGFDGPDEPLERDQAHEAHPKPAVTTALEPQPRPRPLLSPTSDAAVANAFGELANTIFGDKTRTIEGVVEDMLRPMLQSWLDNNLPSLVDRLVRDEIERVSRRRR